MQYPDAIYENQFILSRLDLYFYLMKSVSFPLICTNRKGTRHLQFNIKKYYNIYITKVFLMFEYHVYQKSKKLQIF